MHLFDPSAATGFVASVIVLLGLWMFLDGFCHLVLAMSSDGVSIG